MFSLGGMKTHDTIFNFFNSLRWQNKLTKYARISILMVSSVLCITSQDEHTKKHNNIDSESKSVK